VKISGRLQSDRISFDYYQPASGLSRFIEAYSGSWHMTREGNGVEKYRKKDGMDGERNIRKGA
jgi:hypothetical protein